MRCGMILAVVLTFITMALGVDKTPPMNGFWWDETPDIAKTGFVIGYVAGIDHANKLLVEALEAHKTSLASAQSDAALESYMNFYEISFGKLRNGLMDFYKDGRNKRININLAILYVRDEIRGMSQEESNRRLESLRKETIEQGYDDLN
jgi:hypothetical protein